MTNEAMAEIRPNADQITYWNEVTGGKWVANQDRLDRLMAPLGAALLAEAAATQGERVVDIGCGCGDISLRLADAVGPHGSVLGVDISQPMLAHAEVRRAALPPADRALVRWLRADAMVHPFQPDADLMVSRFGVMFFDDRPRAFANLRKALRPGARFAFIAWRRRVEVEWMQAPMEWLADLFPTPAEVEGEIGPCALANADSTRRLFMQAGFRDVAVELIDRPLTIGVAANGRDAIDDALKLLTEAGPAAALTRGAEPDIKQKAEALMREGLERHAGVGPVTLGGACWLYSGRV